MVLLVPGCPKHPHASFHISIDWFPEKQQIFSYRSAQGMLLIFSFLK